jgi:hypothetical protein
MGFASTVDRWVWKPNEEDGFSVKTAFDSLMGFHIENHCSNFELKTFSSLWDSPAPSKVVAFSWQLLHDHLPTKDNLRVRGVIQHVADSYCVWCNNIP